MTEGTYGDLELERLRSGEVPGLPDESALGAAGSSDRTLFLLANSLPVTPSASLMGHPVGPSTWEEVTSQQDLLRDLGNEADFETTIIAGPEDLSQKSEDALNAVKNGRLPEQSALMSLAQEIIMRRPVLRVHEHDIEAPDPGSQEFNALWPGFVAGALPMLGSVGVIGNVYVVDGKDVHAPQGTAWVVAPGVVATNAHVARALSECGWVRGSGDKPGEQAAVGFAIRQDSEGPRATCRDVVALDTAADIALISLECPDNAMPSPVDLDPANDGEVDDLVALDGVQKLLERKVAVIGYPLPDAQRNPLMGDLVLQLSGGFQSVAPGRIKRVKGKTFLHDCSTTGGNSGSPVMDLATGAVLGIHRAGTYVLGSNIASDVGALRDLVATLA